MIVMERKREKVVGMGCRERYRPKGVCVRWRERVAEREQWMVRVTRDREGEPGRPRVRRCPAAARLPTAAAAWGLWVRRLLPAESPRPGRKRVMSDSVMSDSVMSDSDEC